MFSGGRSAGWRVGCSVLVMLMSEGPCAAVTVTVTASARMVLPRRVVVAWSRCDAGWRRAKSEWS